MSELILAYKVVRYNYIRNAYMSAVTFESGYDVMYPIKEFAYAPENTIGLFVFRDPFEAKVHFRDEYLFLAEVELMPKQSPWLFDYVSGLAELYRNEHMREADKIRMPKEFYLAKRVRLLHLIEKIGANE